MTILPSTILDVGNMAMKKMYKAPTFMTFISQGKEKDISKKTNKITSE